MTCLADNATHDAGTLSTMYAKVPFTRGGGYLVTPPYFDTFEPLLEHIVGAKGDGNGGHAHLPVQFGSIVADNVRIMTRKETDRMLVTDSHLILDDLSRSERNA